MEVLRFTTQLTGQFFTASNIVMALDAAERKQLGRIGAYIRRGAIWSLRRRKKPAPPGKPPSVHSRHVFATLRNILYVYRASTHSVIVGPVGIGKHTDGKTVPEIHEHGATIRLRQWQPKGDDLRKKMGMKPNEWRAVSPTRKTYPWMRYRFRSVSYPKRPFMRPVLERQQTQAMILKQWRGAVRAV